jgi:hypothetical protein
LAATNRWLTAADACVSRYPTKLAFCSRFRRQREQPEIYTDTTVLFDFFGEVYTCFQASKTASPQSTKRPAVKNRQPSHSATGLT